jgi:hypothetical protein
MYYLYSYFLLCNALLGCWIVGLLLCRICVRTNSVYLYYIYLLFLILDSRMYIFEQKDDDHDFFCFSFLICHLIFLSFITVLFIYLFILCVGKVFSNFFS